MTKTPSLPTLLAALPEMPEARDGRSGELIQPTDRERELVRLLVEEPATEEVKDSETGQTKTRPLRRSQQWEKASERAGFGTGESAARAARRQFRRPAVLALYLEHCQELLRSGTHLAYQRLLSIIESSRSERAAIEAIRLLAELTAGLEAPAEAVRPRFGVTILLGEPQPRAAPPQARGKTLEQDARRVFEDPPPRKTLPASGRGVEGDRQTDEGP